MLQWHKPFADKHVGIPAATYCCGICFVWAGADAEVLSHTTVAWQQNLNGLAGVAAAQLSIAMHIIVWPIMVEPIAGVWYLIANMAT